MNPIAQAKAAIADLRQLITKENNPKRRDVLKEALRHEEEHLKFLQSR